MLKNVSSTITGISPVKINISLVALIVVENKNKIKWMAEDQFSVLDFGITKIDWPHKAPHWRKFRVVHNETEVTLF